MKLGAFNPTIGMDAGGQSVQVLGGLDRIAHAQRDHFPGIGDRAAAQRQDQVGLRLRGLLGGLDHSEARRVRRHGFEQAHAARAQHRLELLHSACLTRQAGTGQHVNTLGAHGFQLDGEGLCKGAAVDDSLGMGITVNTRTHGGPC